MSNFIITPNGGSAIPFAKLAGDGSDLAAAGKVWRTRPRASTPNYGIDAYKGPAQDGKNLRRHGFDECSIDNISVLYIATSPAAVVAAWLADLVLIMNIQGGCVLTLPDYPNPFNRCECMLNEPVRFADGALVKPTGFGGGSPTYRMKIMMRFVQMEQ